MRSSTALLVLSAPLVALAAPLLRRTASANTVLVLQFAHALELLETQFYTQALAKFSDGDFNTAGFSNAMVPKQQFQTILFDESSHTDVLASTLTTFGAKPITCGFDFSSVLGDVKTMAGTARLVENLGVSAYLGGAALIDDPQILNAAASILTVEARHQTILNLLNGGSTISSAFDMVLSPPQVLSVAQNFITSGCDLGITPNPALAVKNTGTVAPGTKLELSSKAITGSTANLTCQMMVGGAPFAIALPFDNCVVPEGINGLVYIYVTNTTQPLLSNIQNQFAGSIIAGPTGTFVDTQPEMISQVLLGSANVASGSNSNSGSSNNSGNSGTSSSSSDSNNGNSGSSTSSASGAASTTVSTTTISPAAASALASRLSSASPSSPTGSSNVAAGIANLATGPNGPVNVVGWSSMPNPTASAAPKRK